MDIETMEKLGHQFADHYYSLFDDQTTRMNLRQLYDDAALLTFEGERQSGKDAILTKLQSIPCCRRQITRLDIQPIGADRILVVVLGKVITEGEQIGLGFDQIFILRMDMAKGECFITNDVFQLTLHNN